MSEAIEFERFMNEVWADNAAPTADGGMVLMFSDLYDEWHNARKSAKARGGQETEARDLAGDEGAVWVFPDGSEAWVAGNGAAVLAL